MKVCAMVDHLRNGRIGDARRQLEQMILTMGQGDFAQRRESLPAGLGDNNKVHLHTFSETREREMRRHPQCVECRRHSKDMASCNECPEIICLDCITKGAAVARVLQTLDLERVVPEEKFFLNLLSALESYFDDTLGPLGEPMHTPLCAQLSGAMLLQDSVRNKATGHLEPFMFDPVPVSRSVVYAAALVSQWCQRYPEATAQLYPGICRLAVSVLPKRKLFESALQMLGGLSKMPNLHAQLVDLGMVEALMGAIKLARKQKLVGDLSDVLNELMLRDAKAAVLERIRRCPEEALGSCDDDPKFRALMDQAFPAVPRARKRKEPSGSSSDEAGPRKAHRVSELQTSHRLPLAQAQANEDPDLAQTSEDPALATIVQTSDTEEQQENEQSEYQQVD